MTLLLYRSIPLLLVAVMSSIVNAQNSNTQSGISNHGAEKVDCSPALMLEPTNDIGHREKGEVQNALHGNVQWCTEKSGGSGVLLRVLGGLPWNKSSSPPDSGMKAAIEP